MAAPSGTIPTGAPGEPEAGSMGRIGAEETSWRNFICRSSHPVAAFFHIFFKAVALFLYMFGKIIGLDFVTIFVTSVLALAFDFWTTKNITGRLLVGLRWWVKIKEDGSNEWFFESAPALRVPQLDRNIFWWTLYATPLVWLIFASLAFISFSFDWFIVDLVAMGLTAANLVGYFKCSSDAQKRLRATLTSGAMTGLSYIPGALPAIGTTMLNFIGAGGLSSGGGARAGNQPVGGAAPRASAVAADAVPV